MNTKKEKLRHNLAAMLKSKKKRMRKKGYKAVDFATEIFWQDVISPQDMQKMNQFGKQIQAQQFESEDDELVDDISPNAPIQGTSGTAGNSGGAKVITLQRCPTKPATQDPQKPNLTVVGGKASDIKLFQDKTKGITTTQNTSDTVNKAPNPPTTPSTSNTTPNNQLPKPRKRMTAASFMKPDFAPSMYTMNYPKGIPKSFLIREQNVQLVQNMANRFQNKPGRMKNNSNQYNWLKQSTEPIGQPTVPIVQSTVPTGQSTATILQSNAPTAQSTVTSQSQNIGQSTVTADQLTDKDQSTGSQLQSLMAIDPFAEIPNKPVDRKAYSPSDIYDPVDAEDNNEGDNEGREGSESPDMLQPGEKRLSAFKRLGPLSQPKKPKLTINLLCNKDVREVVDETADNIPLHLRPDIENSTDDIVRKYLKFWPWKRNVVVSKTVCARQSKSVMLLEQENMDTTYEKDNVFIQVNVTGYPPSWKKEDVLDALLESVKGKSFIPCFIDFNKEKCRFLVIRSREALLHIHRCGFTVTKDNVQLILSISKILLNLNHIDFIPRLILRRRLSYLLYDTELDLKEFTLGNDISYFIYYPLSCITNQTKLIEMKSDVCWELLTKLDVSHNKITSLSGFDLPKTTPHLKHLNIGYNRIEKTINLMSIRNLNLQSIVLEGNPLCHDYIQQDEYIKVLKLMFPLLNEIDGVPLKMNIKSIKRNYCTADAAPIIDRYLELFYPLLESPPHQRKQIQNMYHEDAVLTITFMYKLRYTALYREHYPLFSSARVLEEGETQCVRGAARLAAHVARWPPVTHCANSFTLDLMYHSESATIFRVGGILEIIPEKSEDDEYLLSFTRTVVLVTENGVEHKIANEMLYWDIPTTEMANTKLYSNPINPGNVSLEFDSPPDDELKEHLMKIFMKLTEMPKEPSLKCLKKNEWHLKNALHYFSSLLLNDNLTLLMS